MLVGEVGQQRNGFLVDRAENDIHLFHLALGKDGTDFRGFAFGIEGMDVKGNSLSFQTVGCHEETLIEFHHARLLFRCSGTAAAERKDEGGADGLIALRGNAVFAEQFFVARRLSL